MKLLKSVNKGTFSSIYLTDEDTVYKHFKNENNSAYYLAPVEITILRCLEHTNNYVQFDKIIYSNKLISGFTMLKYKEDLHWVIHKNTLRKEQKKIIMHQVLDAVSYLHDIDIIHGDIKPGNILLDNDDNAFLCDFNSCHFLTSTRQQTNNNSYTYTLWYRPPEVILEKPITKSCDIWSLGVVFVELLTNKLGIMTNYVCPVEDNDNNQNFIFKNQLEFFKKEKSQVFWKHYKITDNQEISFLESFLKLEPLKRSTAQMLLCHAYLNDDSKKEKKFNKVPQDILKEFSNFNTNMVFECIENEIKFLEEQLQLLNPIPIRYENKKDFYHEILHYTHYIYIVTKNKDEKIMSQSIHLLSCYMIALKFLDPYNPLIEVLQKRINDTQTWMYTEFNLLFQNTVYYKVHSKISKPSKMLKELLKTMLYFSFPEEAKSTEDVANMLIEFSENKNHTSKYYENLKIKMTPYFNKVNGE